jgi:hypothetical protein
MGASKEAPIFFSFARVTGSNETGLAFPVALVILNVIAVRPPSD